MNPSVVVLSNATQKTVGPTTEAVEPCMFRTGSLVAWCRGNRSDVTGSSSVPTQSTTTAPAFAVGSFGIVRHGVHYTDVLINYLDLRLRPIHHTCRGGCRIDPPCGLTGCALSNGESADALEAEFWPCETIAALDGSTETREAE
jgi:hypothetical protein